jgi:hypothetical protein
MVQQPVRRRGGQEGNKNALKHGYYAKVFTKEEKHDYCLAGSVEGIDQEIALIRHVIKSVANEKDKDSLSILVRATNALNRLLRTRHKLTDKSDNIREAIAHVVEDFLIPMGVNIGPDFFHSPRHIQSETKNEDETSYHKTKNEHL